MEHCEWEGLAFRREVPKNVEVMELLCYPKARLKFRLVGDLTRGLSRDLPTRPLRTPFPLCHG